MPGRNEQCPCGSGIKYKRCCLQRDRDATEVQIKAEQLEREASAAVAKSEAQALKAARIEEQRKAQPPAPIKPPDPLQEAIYARWEEFGKADDEACIALFLKTLDEPHLMDHENAFEMVSRIHDIGIKSGNRARTEEFIGLLRERLPDVYAEGRNYYLKWRISNALATARSELVMKLACEMAETAGDDVDNYSLVVDRLAYHGQLAELSKASHIAWPLIKASTNILWGQQEYAHWGAYCVLFEALERTPKIDGRDPHLFEQVRYYYENLETDPFQECVDRVSGHAMRTWALCDFDFNLKKRKSRKRRQNSAEEAVADEPKPLASGQVALSHLADEFINYAHRQEGIPYTKVELARKNITRYFLDRHAGRLVLGQSPMDVMKRKSKSKRPLPGHPLCPDQDTLHCYLSALIGMLNMQYHDLAAMFELLPVWLRFLETRSLIEPSQRESTLTEIGNLHAEFVGLFESHCEDPDLAESFRKWPENAARPVESSLINGDTVFIDAVSNSRGAPSSEAPEN